MHVALGGRCRIQSDKVLASVSSTQLVGLFCLWGRSLWHTNCALWKQLISLPYSQIDIAAAVLLIITKSHALLLRQSVWTRLNCVCSKSWLFYKPRRSIFMEIFKNITNERVFERVSNDEDFKTRLITWLTSSWIIVVVVVHWCSRGN